MVALFSLVGCGGPRIDSRTLCPAAGPVSKTVLILDMSDPLELHQLVALDRFTESLVNRIPGPEGVPRPSENYIPKGHMLVVYQLATAQDPPQERFRMCNPGSPEDRRAIDGFTEGDVAAMVRWSQFANAMRSVVPKEARQESAPSSPIIETVRYVRNKEFPGAADMRRQSETPRHAILVVSDLLQNSDLVSHYAGLPAVDGLPQSLAVDLTGIDIGVRYLRSQRDAHLQTGEHFAWWRRFFTEAGAPMSRTPDSW